MSSDKQRSTSSHESDPLSFPCCPQYPNTHEGKSSRPTENGGYASTSNPSSTQHSNNLGYGTRINQQPFDAEKYPTSSTAYLNTKSPPLPPCPYHAPILNMTSAQSPRGQGLSPMDRFMAEGPSEQSALFNRADTGKSSTWRECTCYARMENGSLGHN